MPLSHPPGHAQCDFGEAVAIVGGLWLITASPGRASAWLRNLWWLLLPVGSHLTFVPGSPGC